MKKITRDAVRAFVNGEEFKRDNTHVYSEVGDMFFTLHGHIIARRIEGIVYIRDAGWQTNTTKERLNGILDAYHADSYIFQKDFQWYLSRHGEVEPFPSNEWVEI